MPLSTFECINMNANDKVVESLLFICVHAVIFIYAVRRWYHAKTTNQHTHIERERVRAKESRKTASVSIVNFDFVSSIKLKDTHTHPNTLNRMPFLSLSHQFHFFSIFLSFAISSVLYVIPLIFSRFGCCCWFFVCFSNRIGTCGFFFLFLLILYLPFMCVCVRVWVAKFSKR